MLNCIKCKTLYQSDDPEPYYCPSCLEETKKIAAQVDAKLASIPRKEVKSELQIYEESMQARGKPFASAKDLGLI